MSTIDSRVVYYLGLLFGIPHTVGFGDCVLNGIVRTIDFGDCALNGIARTIDFGDCLRRSHAGHFFCVFSLIIWTFFFFVVFLSRSYTNSSIFILAEGNTPYGKRHNSRTESLFWLQSTRYLRRKLTFTAIFLYNFQINSTHPSTRKTPQKRTLQSLLRHLLVNLKKRTSSRATEVVWHWTSATMPTIRIATGSSL